MPAVRPAAMPAVRPASMPAAPPADLLDAAFGGKDLPPCAEIPDDPVRGRAGRAVLARGARASLLYAGFFHALRFFLVAPLSEQGFFHDSTREEW